MKTIWLKIGFLYNIPGSIERSVLNVFNIQALHSFVKVTLYTIMDMVVNYYGQKYAERSYGYKYLLHKRVPNPLKSI